MDYKKLPIKTRNQNIQNISVVLNTLDAINFPHINRICRMDLDRFKLINTIQSEFGDKLITKDMAHEFCVAYEKNI